jgi:hypothetical protein
VVKAASGTYIIQHLATADSPGMPLQAMIYDKPHLISVPNEIGLLLRPSGT